MSDQSNRVKQWRHRAKNYLIECFDGKCNKCGYNNCLKAMDFHHLKDKEISFAAAFSNQCKWSLLTAEAAKCILLCCRCHREIHAGMWKIEDIVLNKFDAEKAAQYNPAVVESSGKCPICQKDVFGTITCSLACAGKKRSKCKWPEKDEFILLRAVKSRSQIAKAMSVTETAVRKREKKYGM